MHLQEYIYIYIIHIYIYIYIYIFMIHICNWLHPVLLPMKSPIASQVARAWDYIDRCSACSGCQHVRGARKDGGNRASTSSSISLRQCHDACTVAAIHPRNASSHSWLNQDMQRLTVQVSFWTGKGATAMQGKIHMAELNAHTWLRAWEGMAATVPSRAAISRMVKTCTVAAICSCTHARCMSGDW